MGQQEPKQQVESSSSVTDLRKQVEGLQPKTIYVAAKLVRINEAGGVEIEVAGTRQIFAQTAVRFDEDEHLQTIEEYKANLLAAPVEAPRSVTFRNKIQSWANNAAVYEKQHRKEGNELGAQFHCGMKQAFQRVVDEWWEPILYPPPLPPEFIEASNEMIRAAESLTGVAAPKGAVMKYRKKPVVVEATQWFKNGDHPLDYENPKVGIENGQECVFSGAERKEKEWEGEIVRYFRRPDISGNEKCQKCGEIMHVHGWIDTLEGGHIVCPGDYIITGVAGENYPCKPAIFEATYEGV